MTNWWRTDLGLSVVHGRGEEPVGEMAFDQTRGCELLQGEETQSVLSYAFCHSLISPAGIHWCCQLCLILSVSGFIYIMCSCVSWKMRSFFSQGTYPPCICACQQSVSKQPIGCVNFHDTNNPYSIYRLYWLCLCLIYYRDMQEWVLS